MVCSNKVAKGHCLCDKNASLVTRADAARSSTKACAFAVGPGPVGKDVAMRSAFRLAFVALLLCGTASFAADTFESVLKEMSATMKELLTTLKSVKDADTAKAAVPKLKKVNEKGEDVAKRLTKLGKPTKAEDEALLKKFIDESQAFGKDLETEMKRIKDVKGAEEVIKLMEKGK